MKRNKGEIEARLAKDFAWYEGKADQVARRAFQEHVKPFCRNRGWRFLAGNGTWAFYLPSERGIGDPDDLPGDEEWAEICDLLSTDIPGLRANDLGSLMPDCRDPTYQEEP